MPADPVGKWVLGLFLLVWAGFWLTFAFTICFRPDRYLRWMNYWNRWWGMELVVRDPQRMQRAYRILGVVYLLAGLAAVAGIAMAQFARNAACPVR